MPENIHDKFFKGTMSKPEAAKDFLQELLPSNIKSLINLDTLKLERGSYVDEKLKEYLISHLRRLFL